MQDNNNTSLREMLEQLPSEELRSKMMQELQKDVSDPDLVRLMLSILEDREMGQLADEPDPQMDVAWKLYQERVRIGLPKRKPKQRRNIRWLSWAAAVVVVLLMFVPTLPQEAEAGKFWDFLNQWKDYVVEFFSPNENVRNLENTFETDHEGMQLVYDETLKLGVDDPKIPKWFDEAFKVDTFEVVNTPYSDGIIFYLADADNIAILRVDIFQLEEKYHGFCRDEEYLFQFEENGAEYKVTQNINRWVAIWNKGNVEYSLSIVCSEDILWKILGSTYETENIK